MPSANLLAKPRLASRGGHEAQEEGEETQAARLAGMGRGGGRVVWVFVMLFQFVCFFYPPTAESFGVSAQIGSGVVRGIPQARFHEGSTRVLRRLRVRRLRVRALKRTPHAVGDIT